MRFRVVLVLVLAAALSVGAIGLATATDLTLFVASDTHFTGKSLPARLKPAIQAMNGLPATDSPVGAVGVPAAVIVAGDLCDGGAGIGATDTPNWYRGRNYQEEWTGFNTYLPKSGGTGTNVLHYPTLATAGNHDYYRNYGQALSGKSTYVARKLLARYGLSESIPNGNVYYGVDLDGVRVISLGRWTDSTVLTWLASDLAATGRYTPVVLFLHYAFDDGQLWYTDAERQRLADVIAGYNVIAILHGHTHGAHHYVWKGYDVYDDGTAGYNSEFGVLHITDTGLTYAQYQAAANSTGNWAGGTWKWAHAKSLAVPAGPLAAPGADAEALGEAEYDGQ